MKKLIEHSSHYLAGLFGGLAIGFISFPIFTRIFSVADYGMIDFIQKILLVPTALSKAGMQNSVLRFYNEKEFASNRRIRADLLLDHALRRGGHGGGHYPDFPGGRQIPAEAVRIDGPLATLLCFASALILLRAIESILLSFLRIEERTAAYNAAQVLMKAAMVGTVCAFLPWIGRSVRTYLSGTMAAELVFVVVLVLWLFRRHLLSVSFDGALFRSAVGFGLPLIFYELAGVILLTADRALVRYYLGAEALGYYSVAYGLSQYVNDLMTVPLGLAILPIYLRLWKSRGPRQDRGVPAHLARFLSHGGCWHLHAGDVRIA